MINFTSTLTEVLDIEKWQQLQDSLALVTKMALITIDYTGTPVTEHSSCSSFCQHIRNTPQLKELCYKCDSRGGLESVRSNAPYIYYCHFGIIDIAIPIIVDNKYIGAVMAGQVRLANPAPENSLEQLLTPTNQTYIKSILSEHRDAFEELPFLSMSRIRTISDLLFHLCNYIIEEALDKELKLKTCMSLVHKGMLPDSNQPTSGFEIGSINRVKREVSNSLLDVLINERQEVAKEIRSPLLQPAFDYIQSHKGETILLTTVSDLCHISPSYFSRVFAKETGVTFKSYISNMKLVWAKELLETTQMPINQISDTLGFNDAGYLIKKFKETFGVTPHVYRNNLK